jgi:hypothetical protein
MESKKTKNHNIYTKMSGTNDISFNGVVYSVRHNPITDTYYYIGDFTSVTVEGTSYNVGRIVSIKPGATPIVSNLNGGTNNYFKSIAVSGSDLYACGSFNTVGDISANNIAKWNGTSWSTLGSGTNNSCESIAVSGSDVYVCGNFTQAGGIIVNFIAKWNGTSWSALGSGLNGQSTAIAVSGTDVYASFIVQDGTPRHRVAKWNGTSWSILDGGVGTGKIYTLAVNGTDVYAGGSFSTAYTSDNNPIPQTSRITKWNGTSWTSVGGGFSMLCIEIAIDSPNVYAVGGFITGTGNAKVWDGTSWSSVGNIVTPQLWTVIVNGSNVYVAGGDLDVPNEGYAARWDGTSWSNDIEYTTVVPPPPSPPTPPPSPTPAPTGNGSAIINLPFIFDLSAQSIEIFGEEVSLPDASFNLTTDLSLNVFTSSFLFKDNESGNMDISFVETSTLKNHINLLNSTNNLRTLQLVSVDGQGGPNYTQFSKVGSSFTPQDSSICNHFLQYVASLLFGHPQAQAPIKNDTAILADLSGDDLGGQFITELSNNHVVRHSMLEQLIDADVSNERFDYSHNDTYHSYPFLDGDKIVFRVKMQGNLFVDAISSLGASTTVQQSTISALFNNITGIDAQNGKVSERIWKVTATLRQ